MTRLQSAIAIAALLVVGVVVGVVVWARGGSGGTAVSANDVVAAPVCVSADGQLPPPGMSCRSPDGAWSVTYTGGSLRLQHRGSTSVLAYQSNDDCCTEIMWAKPHTLLFVDDYQVFRLGPVTRKHTIIAGWSNLVASPDGRWIAGWAMGAEDSASPAETVTVLSIDGKTCLAVPHTSTEDDQAAGFTRDGTSVVVERFPFEPGSGLTGGPPHLVAYAISSLPATKEWC